MVLECDGCGKVETVSLQILDHDAYKNLDGANLPGILFYCKWCASAFRDLAKQKFVPVNETDSY